MSGYVNELAEQMGVGADDDREIEKPDTLCRACGWRYCRCADADNRRRLLTSPFGLDADEVLP